MKSDHIPFTLHMNKTATGLNIQLKNLFVFQYRKLAVRAYITSRKLSSTF